MDREPSVADRGIGALLIRPTTLLVHKVLLGPPKLDFGTDEGKNRVPTWNGSQEKEWIKGDGMVGGILGRDMDGKGRSEVGFRGGGGKPQEGRGEFEEPGFGRVETHPVVPGILRRRSLVSDEEFGPEGEGCKDPLRATA